MLLFVSGPWCNGSMSVLHTVGQGSNPLGPICFGGQMVKSPVREAGSYGFESHLKHVAYGVDVMVAYTFPTRIVRVRVLHTVLFGPRLVWALY